MSLKRNIIYNILLTCSSYISSLLVFPHVSRTLGPEHIGAVNYVDSLAQYGMLFSSLGILALGTREVAAHRNNYDKLKEVFSSLLSIHIVFTIFVVLVYSTIFILFLRDSIALSLFVLSLIKLVFAPFLIEWLYRGVEKFDYICLRSFIVRILFILFAFLLIQTREDAVVYYLLLVASYLINCIVNISQGHKFVRFSYSSVKPFRYLRMYISMGFFFILISFYTTFNVTYLGMCCDNLEVGYYTTAIKIYTVILSIYTAFTGALLPRMSSYAEQNTHEKIRQLLNITIDALLRFSIPCIVISIYYSPEIVRVLAGADYESAILPMRIVMSLVLIVGLSQALAVQLLIPMRKEKSMIRITCSAAIVGVLLNLILVPRYGAIGSACVLLVSEVVGVILYVCEAHRLNLYNIQWNRFIVSIAPAAVYSAICFLVSCIALSELQKGIIFLCCFSVAFVLFNHRLFSCLVQNFLRK